MKRAILVSSGTLAGLAAVLTYSGADVVPAIAAGPVDSAALGAPPAIGAGDPSASASGDPSSASATPGASSADPAAASPSAAATKAAAVTPPVTPGAKPVVKPAVKPAAAPTTAAKVAPVVAPKPTVAAPKPTPKPVVTGPKDYIGSSFTHKYGTIQVGIRVQNGKIIAVWPVVYPNGPSQPYSDFSIPVLKSETMQAQSASIANVSGATLTWQGWKISLTAAMHKAGM